jgi:hypothetical protein
MEPDWRRYQDKKIARIAATTMNNATPRANNRNAATPDAQPMWCAMKGGRGWVGIGDSGDFVW